MSLLGRVLPFNPRYTIPSASTVVISFPPIQSATLQTRAYDSIQMMHHSLIRAPLYGISHATGDSHYALLSALPHTKGNHAHSLWNAKYHPRSNQSLQFEKASSGPFIQLPHFTSSTLPDSTYHHSYTTSTTAFKTYPARYNGAFDKDEAPRISGIS